MTYPGVSRSSLATSLILKRVCLLVMVDFARKCKSLTSTDLGLSYVAVDTLDYLMTHNRLCRRWAENYHERTKLMMDLFFSMGSQMDSRTNLEIANLTSKIARDAQRDSSSMITIAAVTMIFLPGTFISLSFTTSMYVVKFYFKIIDISCRACLTK